MHSHLPTAQEKALDVLQNVFGYQQFRADQESVIHHLIEGKDCVVLMPTGAGKSLCYQVPALVRPGSGVVISPLIALMHDQVLALQGLGVRAACLNSSMSWEEIQAVENAWARGYIDLLYVAPERLLTPRTLSLLKRTPFSLFAIDEAHCVSQWGMIFTNKSHELLTHLRFFYNFIANIRTIKTRDKRFRLF